MSMLQFKPVGILYDILIEYSTASIINLLSERVIGRSGTTNTLMPVVEVSNAQLATESPNITALDYIANTDQYAITIENNSENAAYDVYVADWHDASIFSGSQDFETLSTTYPSFSYKKESVGPRSATVIAKTSTDTGYEPLVSTVATYFRNIGSLTAKSQMSLETFDIALMTLTNPFVTAFPLAFASGIGYFRANVTNKNAVNVSVSIRQQWYYQNDNTIIKDVTSLLTMAANSTHRTPSYVSEFTEKTKVKLTVTFTAGALIATTTTMIENIAPTRLISFMV